MNPKSILSDLVYHPLKVANPEEGLSKVSAIDGAPEIVYVFLEYIHPKNFHKKNYYHIQRISTSSRLDSWIFEHLVNNEQFGKYLDLYRGAKGINSDNIDQFILRKHYYPQALKILKQKKNFDMAIWTKPRYQFSYTRKSNLFFKTGEEIGFDFRNTIEVLFTVKQKEDRLILAIGGSGSSGQRESNTLFTAVYYLLSKRKTVRYHFLKYDGQNEFQYIRSYPRILLTDGFGSNYDLEERLSEKIRDEGKESRQIPEIKRKV